MKRTSIAKTSPLIVVAAVLLAAITVGTAFAAEESHDGLAAQIAVDRPACNQGDTLTVTAQVKNTNDQAVENVTLDVAVPEGFTLAGGSNSAAAEQLDAGAVLELEFTAQTGSPTPVPTPNPNPSSLNTKTGDDLSAVAWIASLVISLVVLGFVSRKRNSGKRYGSALFLVLVCVSLVVPAAFAHAVTITKAFSLSEQVTVGGEAKSFAEKVTYSWEDDIAVESVSVDPATLSLTQGAASTLTATVFPIDATIKSVTWSSSDSAVATVDQAGVVTAVQVGTATITATANDGSGKSGSCDVEVVPVAVTGVTLDKTSLDLDVGGGAKLTATVSPQNATDKSVSWESDAPDVVSVDQTGALVALRAGTATITVKTADGGHTATCAVTVRGVQVDPAEAAVTIGGTWQLTASIIPAVDGAIYTWTSDKEGVATVAADGTVEGITAGEAKITAKEETTGNTAVCTVTVLPTGCSVSSGGEFSAGGDTGAATGNFVIPEKINGITVTSIAGSAFYYNAGLTSVVIPKTVASINDYAFPACTNLVDVEFESPSSLKALGASAFANCSSLSGINLPQGLTTIGRSCFSRCAALTGEFDIPSSVTSIENYAFLQCENLESVSIPANVTSLSESLFANCFKLQSVDLPEGLKTIGSEVFSKCYALESVSIPSGVTAIGHHAFALCKSLTSVEIPSGVSVIEGAVFNQCSSLSSVSLPDGITVIGEHAFSQCGSLTNLALPAALKEIGAYALSETGLQSVVVPDSVTKIGGYAFYKCESLTSITLPQGGYFTTLETALFAGCTSLTSMTIPSSVTTVNSASPGVFAYAANLSEIVFTGVYPDKGPGYSQCQIEGTKVTEIYYTQEALAADSRWGDTDRKLFTASVALKP